MPRLKLFFKWAIPILLFLILSFDGKTHWDETNFLYKAAYAPYATGELWLNTPFYYVRIAHLGVLRLLFLVFGKGIPALFMVESVMALMIIGAALLFYKAISLLFGDEKKFYLVFLTFLFAPLSIYLGFKALGETTAIFFASLSIFLYALSLKRRGFDSLLALLSAALSLFFASYAREAIILGFFSFIFSFAVLDGRNLSRALKNIALIGGIWLLLYISVFLLFNIRCTDYVFKGLTPEQVAKDIAEYPPNIFGIFLFGGGFWFLVVIAFLGLKYRPARVGLLATALAMIPIAIRANHIEMRYLIPGIYGFTLLAGVGLGNTYRYTRKKFGNKPGLIIVAGLFVVIVGANQLLRPFDQVGTDGKKIVYLMGKILNKCKDPFVIVAHPHSTYSFLRICYPDQRIALDRKFYDQTPLMARAPEDVIKHEGPYLYLSPRGRTPKPFLLKLYHRIRGVTSAAADDMVMPKDSWVTSSDYFHIDLMSKEEPYRVYRLSTDETDKQ
jgi:hypothetical protein